MKRFLHAGDGYAQNSLTYKLLSPFTRYIQTSSPNKFGWLAYPLWVPKVTGIQFLVALFCFTLGSSPVFGQEIPAVTELRLGDSVPDSFWDLPLQVVNHPEGRDSITLREYKDKKLLVLDFWATWCTPCVLSVQKWEDTVNSIPEMAFIGVHFDYSHKALPFIQRKGWNATHVIGEEMRTLNAFFFVQPRITRSVWLLNGVFVAITDHNGPDVNTIRDVIRYGSSIPSRYEDTYMVDQVRTAKDGGRQ